MSDLEWLHLEGGEEVLWESNPSLITEADTIARGLVLLVSIIGAPIGLILIAVAYLRVRNRAYVITNKQFYKKTGIIGISTDEAYITNMQNFNYQQSFFGKRFNYGTVEIELASEPLVFKNVQDSAGVKNTLTELENTNQSTGHPSTSRLPTTDSASLDRLYRELQLANEAMERLTTSDR